GTCAVWRHPSWRQTVEGFGAGCYRDCRELRRGHVSSGLYGEIQGSRLCSSRFPEEVTQGHKDSSNGRGADRTSPQGGKRRLRGRVWQKKKVRKLFAVQAMYSPILDFRTLKN